MAKTKKKTSAKAAGKNKAKAVAKPKKVAVKPKKAAPKQKPVKSKPLPAPAKPAKRPTKKASTTVEKPSKPDSRPSAADLKLNILPVTNQRPIAHKPAKPSSSNDNKTRYSDEELKEFEELIVKKLTKAREELRILKETLNRNNDEGTDSTSGGNTKVLEDGAETAEKENLGQQAARMQKYIINLENALVRIKNGTYGICSVTGKLISKERLIAVPHTTQSIEAKMMNKD